ncbi:type II secretion system F family protein [Thiomicrorhabdus sp.]|uniref:type II secretion system F family protein n=1 Tax=Thiomicrorhabdus sp. TaxID=2039724 RepID=UPI0029C8D939|nr:type II secretion system F family protein [Thiomicrorhabdus sp.]
MADFRYVALDKQGKEVRGTLDVESETEVASELRLQGLFIVEIEKLQGHKQRLIDYLGHLNPRRYKRVASADLLMFFRQMSLLLRSGHTIVQALESVEPLIKRYRLKRAVKRMVVNIQEGMTFSAAMAEEKSVFPDIAVSLLTAGEVTGETDKIMGRLSEDLDKAIEIKRKLISSLTYPLIVVLASIAVILFLVIGVVPKFATFLGARNAELPASTQALMDMSEWMQDYGPMLGIGVAIAVFLILAAYTQEKSRFFIDRMILKLPLIGSSIIAAGMAKTSWTLSMMLASGLTVLDSVRIASAINANSVLKHSFNQAAERIVQGEKLAVALRQKEIPDMVLHLVASGEVSGELGEVFDELGAFYHKELDSRIKAMTSMIEPALTLIVGGMVGFVYVSFFQAIFAVATGGR